MIDNLRENEGFKNYGYFWEPKYGFQMSKTNYWVNSWSIIAEWTVSGKRSFKALLGLNPNKQSFRRKIIALYYEKIW